MFNTIFTENILEMWLFQLKTDVYFGLFQEKRPLWRQNGDKELSKKGWERLGSQPFKFIVVILSSWPK
jgi:hypothetical protein